MEEGDDYGRDMSLCVKDVGIRPYLVMLEGSRYNKDADAWGRMCQMDKSS